MLKQNNAMVSLLDTDVKTKQCNGFKFYNVFNADNNLPVCNILLRSHALGYISLAGCVGT